jgi:hypothetical protein
MAEDKPENYPNGQPQLTREELDELIASGVRSRAAVDALECEEDRAKEKIYFYKLVAQEAPNRKDRSLSASGTVRLVKLALAEVINRGLNRSADAAKGGRKKSSATVDGILTRKIKSNPEESAESYWRQLVGFEDYIVVTPGTSLFVEIKEFPKSTRNTALISKNARLQWYVEGKLEGKLKWGAFPAKVSKLRRKLGLQRPYTKVR